MLTVKTLPLSSVPAQKLTFVVMITRYKGEWVFIRHKDRQTWELPGGHIDPGETPTQAACRELFEETGARKFLLNAVCNYVVVRGNQPSYGRLFLAEVDHFDDIPNFEIKERIFAAHVPDAVTYPDILPVLFKQVSKN